MTLPAASLSLDLDNQWSYLKTHGDPGWQTFPSYLDIVVPRALDLLAGLGLHITFFVVGQDAALSENRPALAALSAAGHEIGNHSFHHDPWLHLYSETEIETELARAESGIEQATGCRPRGFRGPGFSLSPDVLRVLVRRGYLYDATTFPTFLGPLARAYYLRSTRLSPEERRRRGKLFGSFREGFRPLRPYRFQVGSELLTEIPVTTMPGLRTPVHASYLLFLGGFSTGLARLYFEAALRLCRLGGSGFSLLLHPLDLLDVTDVPSLSFFPAMRRPAAEKIRELRELLCAFQRRFDVLPLLGHAERNGLLAAKPRAGARF